MANRRMFSKTIVDTDDFLDMPISARLLYYDLGMRADDDGFVSPKRVMRITGSADDDLKVLLTKKYILAFENRVLIIRDWKVNNFIRADRYTPTIYQEYLRKLQVSTLNQYQIKAGIPDVIPVVCIGKDRLGKDRIDKRTQKTNNNPKEKKPSIISSYSYLENVPAKDVEEMAQKFSFTQLQVKKEAEKCLDWLKAKGIKRKNYKAQLRNWLRRAQEFKENNTTERRTAFDGFELHK